jgi:hypothetical protein
VFEEAFVLDRDDRLLHPGRDLVVSDEGAALRPAEYREDRLAVRGVDVAVTDNVATCRVELGYLTGDRRDESVRERRQPEDAEDGDDGNEAELSDAAPLARRIFVAKPQQNRPILAR